MTVRYTFRRCVVEVDDDLHVWRTAGQLREVAL